MNTAFNRNRTGSSSSRIGSEDAATTNTTVNPKAVVADTTIPAVATPSSTSTSLFDLSPLAQFASAFHSLTAPVAAATAAATGKETVVDRDPPPPTAVNSNVADNVFASTGSAAHVPVSEDIVTWYISFRFGLYFCAIHEHSSNCHPIDCSGRVFRSQ